MNDAIFLREVSGAGRLPIREARAPFIDNGRLAVLGDVSLHAWPALMVEPHSRCCGGRIGACCRRRLRVRIQDAKASHTLQEHCGAEPWGQIYLDNDFAP
eukprot:SAG31_NODE_6279_length_2089_cov_12.803015_1_plen_100_part_00